MKTFIQELKILNKNFYLDLVKICKKYNIGISKSTIEYDKTIIKGHLKDKNGEYCYDKITVELSNEKYCK